MKVYVLGAGASYPIYPLASRLFQEISNFIKNCGPFFNRFDYEKDWPALLKWLADNPDPLLRQAYRNGNLEQIFTVLDLANSLQEESLTSIMRAAKVGMEEVVAAEAAHEAIAPDFREYEHIRRTLLWATEAYFEFKYHEDSGQRNAPHWAILDQLGQLISEGDVVITFNYDSTIDRVLYGQGKWSPSDGYGTEIVFQKSRHDKTPVLIPTSKVKIIHLHGAIGWFHKPALRPDYPLSEDGGGAIPREALTPAPLETKISLDHLFLQNLGIYEVDASLPDRPSDEYQILIHPSFLKDYEEQPVFSQLWKMASEVLRQADETIIVGYSLPPADSAAMTLFLSNCDRKKMTVVNPDASTMDRYRRLFRLPILRPRQILEQWLANRSAGVAVGLPKC